MAHLLQDVSLYHDATQLRCFVLSRAGFGTTWGIYRQALMELDSRRQTLAARERDLAAATLELRYAKARADGWNFTARQRRDKGLACLEAERYAEDISNLKLQLEHTAREFRIVLEVARACKEELGPVSEERRARLDLEFWEAKLVQEAQAGMLLNGMLPSSVQSLAVQLPQESYERVLRGCGASAPATEMLEQLRVGKVLVDGSTGQLAVPRSHGRAMSIAGASNVD